MKHSRSGFTLMELLVAMAIVSILLAIAYPSYQEMMQRSRRAESVAALEAMAQAQERFFSRFRTYTSVITGPDGCLGTACGLGMPSTMTTNGYYSLTAVGDATSYTVTATAVAAQLADEDCRTMSKNNAGINSATNSSGDDATNICW